MRKLVAILATAGAVAAILPAAADAHISLRYFEISPSCTTPGTTLTARVGITQNHWYEVNRLYSRVIVRQAQTGIVLSQQDEGPEYVPYGRYDRVRTTSLPANTPAGDYAVTLLLGSTQGGSEWGQATRPLRVRTLQALCSL